MKIRINFDTKCVCVDGLDVSDAGWLGFRFAKEHRDLVDEGWLISYGHKSPSGRHGSFSEPVDVPPAAYEVALRIRAGPKKCCHSCCCERCHGYSSGNSCCRR